MKIFSADFNRVITDSVRRLQDAVPLGYEHLSPELTTLRDGETIILDMPGELWFEALATHRDDERGCYWYGELVGQPHYYDEEGAPEDRSQSVSSPS